MQSIILQTRKSDRHCNRLLHCLKIYACKLSGFWGFQSVSNYEFAEFVCPSDPMITFKGVEISVEIWREDALDQSTGEVNGQSNVMET